MVLQANENARLSALASVASRIVVPAAAGWLVEARGIPRSCLTEARWSEPHNRPAGHEAFATA